MLDLGFQLQFPFLFLGVAVLGIIAAIAAILWGRNHDNFAWQITTLMSGLAALALVVVLLVLAFPYNPHYWKLYSVTGTIDNVNTSLQSSGKSISNYYVITLSGHAELFVTENPRILDYKDDRVELVCHANYVYQGADNYDCNIRSVTL